MSAKTDKSETTIRVLLHTRLSHWILWSHLLRPMILIGKTAPPHQYLSRNRPLILWWRDGKSISKRYWTRRTRRMPRKAIPILVSQNTHKQTILCSGSKKNLIELVITLTVRLTRLTRHIFSKIKTSQSSLGHRGQWLSIWWLSWTSREPMRLTLCSWPSM